MRVLFAGLGSSGHVLPVLALAELLRADGHELAYAIPPNGVATVERAGVRALPLGPQERAPQAAERLGLDYERMTDNERSLFQVQVAATGRHLDEWIATIPKLVRDWPPDVLVWSDGAYAGPIAAERLGIPHACVQVLARGLGPFLPSGLAAVQEPMAERISAVRAAVGLDPHVALNHLYRHLVISAFPPSLQSHDGRGVPALVAVRPSPPPASPTDAVPAWISDLPPRDQQPRVYVTLGTSAAPSGNVSLLRAIVAGLGQANVQVIVTSAGIDAGDLGTLPANTHVERYIPQSLLLPHCDLVVFHGGSGTLQGAVDHGLPMVVIPGRADQPDAAGLKAAGAALVLSPQQVSPASVRASVDLVVGDRAFQASAQRLQAELHALSPMARAVALLDSLVRA